MTAANMTIAKTCLVAGILAVCGAANAAPVLCSAGSPHPNGLALTDVTLGTSNASDCYGIVAGNDKVETAWDSTLTLTEVLRWESGTSDTGYLGDVKFTITSDAGTGLTSGVFTLTWEDVDAGAIGDPEPNYDFFADLVFTLKGSPGFASYLFENVEFTTDGSTGGSYTMKIPTNGGPIAGLSHLTMYSAGYTTTSSSSSTSSSSTSGGASNEIPEPGTVTLFGVAMLGGLLTWRRRRNGA